ncbi:MAG: rhodanese-like domain-containing protein [Ignavibacteriaceae bacterium]
MQSKLNFSKKVNGNFKTIFSLLVMISFLTGISLNAQQKNETAQKSSKEKTSKLSDKLSVKQTITPSALANELKHSNYTKPYVLQIGFSFLYNQEHITGSKYAGPASKDEGIDMIKKDVKSLPKKTEIVIYCGCCPWDHCPNVRPAYKALVDLGFTNVKALYLPDDFQQDWKDKGFPVTK